VRAWKEDVKWKWWWWCYYLLPTR